MSFDLDARIDEWRKSLLDTTKRNRLIKFVAGRIGGVNLVHPPAGDLWSRLVRDGSTLTFPWKRELLGLPPEVLDAETLATDFDPRQLTADSGSTERASELTALCLRSQRLRPTHLLTEFNDKQLVARLTRLSRLAQEAATDHGVTTLFAAFGFLRWFERPDSEEEILSPLLLVPVRLHRETLESPFTVSAVEDDLLPNHCLSELLDNQFKIKLPTATEYPLDPEQAECFSRYMQAVNDRIKHVARWSVLETTAIGVFNFQKLAMWEDLGRNTSRIKAHPLCRAIAGDGAAIRTPPQGLPLATELDRVVKPSEAIHILDADSSQHEAIEAVKRGADLVLDGPPGTGKSQTIANIIAEMLAVGKTVLFVSAKIAALEVVKRRLDTRGLGDFCLELHSHKASKKEIISELGRCLDLIPEGTPDLAAQLEELSEARSKLNAFVAELHAVREPLGWSAFRVHGELARLDAPRGQSSERKSAARSRIMIATPFAKDAEFVRKGTDILRGLGDCHSVLDEPGGHPWKECKLTAFSHSARDDAVHSLGEFSLAIPSAHRAAEALKEAGFASEPLTVPEWQSAEKHAVRVLSAPLFPAAWFNTDPRAIATAIVELDAASREARLHAGLIPEFDAASVRKVIDPQDVTFSTDRVRLLSADTLYARNRLELDVQVRSVLEKLRKQLEDADSQGRALAQQLRLGISPLFQELGTLARLAERVAQTPTIPSRWWDPTRRAELVAVVTRAGHDERTAREQRPSLVAKLAPAALEPESSALAREAANAAESFWRWLPWSRWSTLRKSIAAWYPTGFPTGGVLQADIGELAGYHNRMDSAWQVATAYAAELLTDANGKADWTATSEGLRDIEQLETWKAASDLKTMVAQGGSLDRNALKKTATSLSESLTAFEGLWKSLIQALVVSDSNGLFSKSSVEIGTWLETECGGIESEIAALCRVVALLLTGKDVAATALKDRLQHLQELTLARGRIKSSARVLEETRSEELLEAIDHSATAATAKTLLAFLTEWKQPLTPGVIAALSDPLSREKLGMIVRDSEAAHPEFDKAWNRITGELFDPNSLISTNCVLTRTSFPDLAAWTDARIGDVDRLQEWVRFQQMEKDARAFGLDGIIDEVRAGDYPPQEAASAFQARFYRLWVDALHQQVPLLGDFATATQERLIARFADLDRLLIRSTPDRVRNELLVHHERPVRQEGAPEASELGILLREVHKKQRHLPLRKLFAQVPWILPRIKPCLMMSPLAVSTYLDHPDLTFDLVIFDEASQVRPHDAICAIYRGRQLVVGGDPKQLPPTDFFNRTDDDDDSTHDEEGIGNYESLLDVCLSRGLTRKWLRWHYRSQRESLIAFSNHYFYENRLVTFPSAHEASSPAIKFVKVPDGQFKDGVNAVEARRVANLIMEHARDTPKLSLGVIAFSLRQQDRILHELEILRRQNPETENFYSEDGAEPFFVKNLENVQGDERDVIVLVVGYGPDEAGKIAMRFGPLNQQGGERRLNVAVTRARRAMIVVSSLGAADIDLSRTQAIGARLLRAFLDYAARGPVALGEASSGESTAVSAFEQEVGNELARRGLSIQRQIGCGGYRIDLAVTGLQQAGEYLLGIECDGATYSSGATARDRDRLRKTILEGLGWRLVRVWSSDWVRDREKQVKRILTALETAKGAKVLPPASEIEFKKTPISRKGVVSLTEYDDIEAVPEPALGEAIVACLFLYGSMPADELIAAVAKRLGFKRAGPKIRDRAIARVNELVTSGQLILCEDNRVRLAARPVPALSDPEKAPGL